MTQPNPDETPDSGGQGGSGRSGRGAAKPSLLAVGTFTFHDQQTGEDVEGVGVVSSARDGVLVVRPLAGHYLEVDPAEFTPLSADDV